ncbi:MAG: glycogen debranching N-terminal domain-containing protein [Roseiflexaceae bacterium]|nr:glycogen debranching N-terminal domain-containing protein [Roseiflexaceae bacterium]
MFAQRAPLHCGWTSGIAALCAAEAPVEYLVVSDNHTFMISNHDGDIPVEDTPLGLYFYDTRHLSGFQVRLNGQPLELLASSDEHVYHAAFLLTNGASASGEEGIDRQTIAVRRERVVHEAVFERLTITNHNRAPIECDLTVEVAADFADMFVVRGFAGGPRDSIEPVEYQGDRLRFIYRGADDVVRTTDIHLSAIPDTVDMLGAEAPPPSPGPQGEGARRLRQLPVPARAQVHWRIALAPRARWTVDLTITPAINPPEQQHSSAGSSFEAALEAVRASYRAWDDAAAIVTTDNPAFNQLLRRSSHDLRALTARFGDHALPVAGIPWFAVPFGRDSLIASFQALWFQPDLARGTLRYLAAHQGTQDNPWRDEQPGKIMHEMRFGELANTNSVPFNPYYGSIDATLLFLMLFAATVRWTGDVNLYHDLLPAALHALDWIDLYADADEDGYIAFEPRSTAGLRIQGWKDSRDSVLHPDGTLAEPPLALVEVQAYAYAARTWMADLLERMGETDRAAEARAGATTLKERFNADFWLEEEGFYAQAIEVGKGAIREITSNPGHALLCDILLPERAAQVAARLTAPDLLSSWGVRTRSAADPNYNPMSYHNGSVWPHDNSLIVWGLARSGFRDEANEIASRLVAAAAHFRLYRLPELMCGYDRDPDTFDGPVPYPVSCRPQAWAAGTGLMIVRSILGLEVDALANTLRLAPRLPPWLSWIEVQNLRVGERRVHFRATRAGVEIMSDGGVDIRVEG